MQTFLYLVLTLVLLSIMVVIHELGHFLVAKLFKVTILEFSVGMGPAIFTTKKKKKAEGGEINAASEGEIPEKTAFSIRALPIGGYVSMAGEDDASNDANAFCNKAAWQRFLITVAGPVMNILLGILCMFSLVGIQSAQDGYLASNTIYGFQESAISDKCDEPLMAGDTIIKIDGVRVHTGNEVVYEIMNNGYEPIDIVVIRDGNTVTLNDVTFPTESESGATFGNYDFIMLSEKATIPVIMKHAVFRSFSTVKVIIDSLRDLLTGRYGAEAVSGPIGMADAVGDAARAGTTSLLYLFTLITMNLGVFNLLPLPALDGGRIIFLLIEMVARRPIKREIEQTINTVGLMILMGLMILVTVKDIFNLF